MKKFALLLFLLLVACDRPVVPTEPAQTRVPPLAVTTPVPTKSLPPGSGIVVKNVQQTTQASGTTSKIADIATSDNLDLARIELAYLETMTQSDSQRISMRLTPNKLFASLTPMPLPTLTPRPSSSVYNFSGNIQLYSVMYAQLRALAFAIDQPAQLVRTVDGSKEISWDWIVQPKSVGRQDLAIEISIPIIRNGTTTEITTDVLQNVPLTITVLTTPPPTATPQALGSRITDSIINNSGAIFVALIGLIGTVLGIWVKARMDKEKNAPADAPKK